MRVPEISALNAIMREFLPPLQAELDEMDIRHTCGSEFQLSWLDRDGEIWRPRVDMDQIESVLTARCVSWNASRHCPQQESAYNYLRLAINGSAMHRYADNLLRMVHHEVMSGWQDLKRHLETVSMPNWDRAIMRALEYECVGLLYLPQYTDFLVKP